ncbi:MAG TPA: RNA methyltransferase [Candidatus Acidoferrales bacterium]|nr:RNA methyltransferase [Candidatus Acidoferrales bacterium]
MAPSGGPTRNKALRENSASITSRENQWLKRFRAALAGEPGGEGTAGVEGVRLVEAALGSGLAIEALLVSESGARHLPRIVPVLAGDVPVLRTSDKLFASVADTRTPQGIAALVRLRRATIEDCLRGAALVLAMVGVQDPGNVGTMIRAAEAFGSTGGVACSAGDVGTADPFGPKALRASAGAALRLPVVHGIAAGVLIEKLRASGTKVYAAVAAPEDAAGKSPAAPSRSLLPWEVDWKSPSAILIGNEGAGLPEEIVRAADARVCIPQASARTRIGIESLNAAMAASVLLYEAMRQRNTERKKLS